jgi:hypothetical protein
VPQGARVNIGQLIASYGYWALFGTTHQRKLKTAR